MVIARVVRYFARGPDRADSDYLVVVHVKVDEGVLINVTNWRQ